MSSQWDIWTDGSAVCDERLRVGVKGQAKLPGGWAAVVEHGIDGYVLRGRHPATTNVRMEIRAAIEGLREVPDDELVVLHFDCTVIYSVADWMLWPSRAAHEIRDGRLWLLLAHELRRVDVRFDLLGKGYHPIHQRAHAMAGAEARAMALALPSNAEPLGAVSKGDRRRMRRARMRVEELRRERILDVSHVEAARMQDAFDAAGYDVRR